MDLDQVAGGSLVCCLLCRGMIKDGFKDGNIERFRAHMYNEHSVIYDIEYMLASSLMDRAMVEEVATSIRQTQATALLEDRENNMKIEEETLKESTNVSEENIKNVLTVGKIRTVEETKPIEVPISVDESNQCPTCFTHFVAKTMFLQHLRKGCKKGAANKTLDCKDCPKNFTSKLGLKMHVEKKHESKAHEESVENIKEEVDASDLNVSLDESMYKSGHDDSFNSSSNMEDGKVGAERSVVDDENKEYNGTGKVSLKTHVCSLCGKGQSTRANFKGHLGRKHPEQLVSNEFLDSCKVTDQETVLGKAFPCNVCTKGYSNKVRLRQHQIKDHGRVGNSGPEEKRILYIPIINNIEDLESREAGARLRAEELERIKAEYYGVSNEGGAEASTSNFINIEHSGGDSSSTLINPSALPIDAKQYTFLNDINSDFESMNQSSSESLKDSTLETSNSGADEAMSSAIDTSQSRYFQKNPNVFANARGKSLNLFAEEAVGLPSGWKMRSIEREGKEGAKMTSIKHYLTLDHKVLKTGLAVIEYLRLEGKLSPDQLLEVRTTLKISDKKLKDLYE